MYLSAKQVKDLYQITSQTLYNWRKNGKIKFKVLPSGKHIYSPLEESLPIKKQHAIYTRVSTIKHASELINQQQHLKQYMKNNDVILDVEYHDIQSGLNEDRPGFLKLIKDCCDGKIDTIYITHNDRLVRFGFSTLEKFLNFFGTSIIVTHATKEEDFQEELTHDLVNIMHKFLIKMYSNKLELFTYIQNAIKKSKEI